MTGENLSESFRWRHKQRDREKNINDLNSKKVQKKTFHNPELIGGRRINSCREQARGAKQTKSVNRQ